MMLHPLKNLEDLLGTNEFYDSQFQKKGRLNFLWVEPQLSTVSLYRSIMPFFYLYEVQNNIIQFSTALTGLDKYDKQLQLASLHTQLTDEQVDWADVVFFPFTTTDLSEEYKKLRDKKKIICFNVDFNFYELPKEHPLKKFFGANLIKGVEANMDGADFVITSNSHLMKYLGEKKKTKSYVAYIPFYLGSDIINSDIEADNAMLALINRSAGKAPKESKVKIKTKGKQKEQAPAKDNTIYEPVKVGIIYSDLIDYTPFMDTLKKLNKMDNVTLVIVGYNPDVEGVEDKFSGLNYSYVKPCGIKFYFKMLYTLKLDFCMVLLEDNVYNWTSENTNRYLECGIFGVPLIAPDINPYNTLIHDKIDGFIYQDKKQIIDILKFYSSAAMMPLIRNTVKNQLVECIAQKYIWDEQKADSIREIFLKALNK